MRKKLGRSYSYILPSFLDASLEYPGSRKQDCVSRETLAILVALIPSCSSSMPLSDVSLEILESLKAWLRIQRVLSNTCCSYPQFSNVSREIPEFLKARLRIQRVGSNTCGCYPSWDQLDAASG